MRRGSRTIKAPATIRKFVAFPRGSVSLTEVVDKIDQYPGLKDAIIGDHLWENPKVGWGANGAFAQQDIAQYEIILTLGLCCLKAEVKDHQQHPTAPVVDPGGPGNKYLLIQHAEKPVHPGARIEQTMCGMNPNSKCNCVQRCEDQSQGHQPCGHPFGIVVAGRDIKRHERITADWGEKEAVCPRVERSSEAKKHSLVKQNVREAMESVTLGDVTSPSRQSGSSEESASSASRSDPQEEIDSAAASQVCQLVGAQSVAHDNSVSAVRPPPAPQKVIDYSPAAASEVCQDPDVLALREFAEQTYSDATRAAANDSSESDRGPMTPQDTRKRRSQDPTHGQPPAKRQSPGEEEEAPVSDGSSYRSSTNQEESHDDREIRLLATRQAQEAENLCQKHEKERVKLAKNHALERAELAKIREVRRLAEYNATLFATINALEVAVQASNDAQSALIRATTDVDFLLRRREVEEQIQRTVNIGNSLEI